VKVGRRRGKALGSGFLFALYADGRNRALMFNIGSK
jgi:hypothetical protein